jgi:hypothetical protein
VTGFKKCCVSDEMDGKDEVEVENVGSDECVSSEHHTKDGNCEDNEAERDDRNSEQRPVKLNKA